MSVNKMSDNSVNSNIVVGMGYLALDVIYNENRRNYTSKHLGGSTGNVLSILSYLGWKSYPIAAVGHDRASIEIIKEFHNWKIETDFVTNHADTLMPIVIERIYKNKKGGYKSKFEWNCPICKKRLPKYKPMRLDEDHLYSIPSSRVFYFDRVSNEVLDLALDQKNKGSLIVFEPNSIRRNELVRKALALSDIVKYASSQISNIPDELLQTTNLEVQTLGKNGLRYRLLKGAIEKSRWTNLDAYHPSKVIDSTGAGDWCTSGLIYSLTEQKVTDLTSVPQRTLENALQFGQAMASISCNFIGARGLMLNMSLNTLFDNVSNVLRGEQAKTHYDIEQQKNVKLLSFEEVCPYCNVNTRK